jgi:hypothetical protein
MVVSMPDVYPRSIERLIAIVLDACIANEGRFISELTNSYDKSTGDNNAP